MEDFYEQIDIVRASSEIEYGTKGWLSIRFQIYQ